jgi:hypothetical protein
VLEMSKSQRLASFSGPSTPNKLNRVASNPPSPASQGKTTESTTYHRKLRIALLDFRNGVQTVKDLITIDGVKVLKALIDSRTDLEFGLSLIKYERN